MERILEEMEFPEEVIQTFKCGKVKAILQAPYIELTFETMLLQQLHMHNMHFTLFM